MLRFSSDKILRFFGWYNIIGGIFAIGFFKILFPFIYNAEYSKPQHELLLMNHILLFGFVAIVGLGLVIASKNISKNRAIILVSALGKLFACATWAMSYFKGAGSLFLVFGGLTDAGIALLFLVILRKNK